jgi:hypothetical protein
LAGGQKRLFAVQQQLLAVGLELLGDKRLGQGSRQELAVPRAVAIHAIRVVHRAQQVAPDAGRAGERGAAGALHGFAAGPVQVLTTNRAGGHGCGFVVVCIRLFLICVFKHKLGHTIV